MKAACLGGLRSQWGCLHHRLAAMRTEFISVCPPLNASQATLQKMRLDPDQSARLDNLLFENINYCVSLRCYGGSAVGHSLSQWQPGGSSEWVKIIPEACLKKDREEKKKKRKEKQASQKLWWNPVLANASRKFD